MIVLDASMMIAVLDPHDVHFASARNMFRAHPSELKVAHRLTMAESLVLGARAGVTAAVAAAIASLGVELLDELDDPRELAEVRAHTSLKLPDACLLLAARRSGASLATFDKRLADAARSHGIDVVPSA